MVDKYLAAGIAVHTVVHARYSVDHAQPNVSITPAEFETWKKNFDYHVRGVMKHYQGRIFWYIVDNEPEICFDGSGGWMTAQQAVNLTKIVYQAARDIDPRIKVESPPVNRPDSPFLREMMQLGVQNYCDFVGVHTYGGQIDDEVFRRLWELLAEFRVRKPVSASESGANPEWAPASLKGSLADKLEYQRRFYFQFYMQMKRFGVSHALMYSLRTPTDPDDLDILDRPAFEEMKAGFNDTVFSNGGFEDSNNFDSRNLPTNIEIVRNDAANAHGGSSYAKLAPGPASSFRRLAAKLKPGTTYAVEAWVFIQGSGVAHLRALGSHPLDGDAEELASTNVGGSWQKLSLTVTPQHSWLVVDLSANNLNGLVRFDDVTVEATNAPPNKTFDYEAENGTVTGGGDCSDSRERVERKSRR